MVWIIVGLLVLLCGGISVVAYRFGRSLMNVEDNIEFCIDYIENRYNKIVDMVDKSEILYLDDGVKKFVNEFHLMKEDMAVVLTALTNTSTNFKAAMGMEEEAPSEEKQDNVATALKIIEENNSDKKKENKA